MATLTMKELLEAGVHFGHQTKRWNPKMQKYIFGERNGIYIIDLQKTLKKFREAYAFVRDLAAGGGTVLFVGTKKQAQETVFEEATRCGMFYVNQRWLGGTLTNFATIRKSIARLKKLEEMKETGEFERVPKKEALELDREREKLEKALVGIKAMEQLPSAVFIIDPRKEKIAVAGAQRVRDRTGAGVMDCKEALEETRGNVEAAFEYLRKKGLAQAAKRAHREAKEGVVAAYIHPLGAKLGVLVEVNCETDFVAKTDAFQELVKDLLMQIAAQNPTYVAREDVPPAVVEREREVYRAQLADQRKPPQIVDKIVEGKLEKFYGEQCLLEQPFVKDESGKTRVRDLVDAVNAKTGERVVVKRFARFQVGEAG